MMDMSGNPLLDEIDGLSEPAKKALFHAHSTIAGTSLPPSPGMDPGIAPAAPAPIAPIGPPKTPVTLGAPAMSNTALQGHQANLQRLTAPPLTGDMAHTDADTGQTGIGQIHNKWARIPLQIADAIGSGLFPRIAENIPGTQAHHNDLVHQAQGAVDSDEAQIADADKQRLTTAQAVNTESLPELHEKQAELALAKQEAVNEKNDATKRHNEDTNNQHLAASGYKLDENHNIVPLAYEEMSEPQKAIHDLKATQGELADARKEYEKAKTANIPTEMHMAQQRIDNATKNQSVALQRLGLSRDQFNMRAFGTGPDGQALPGSVIGDDNKPVGTAFQQNVRPTGQERNKADLASSAREQLGDIAHIMESRKDIFGPVNGRKTDFNVWLGSQDPDAQRFRAARTIAGDHLAGVFGGRSEAALSALDSAIGQFKDNPEAAIAGVRQLDRANDRFVKAGTVKTTGSNAAKEGGGTPASDMISVQIPGQPAGQIHASQKAAFQKKYPNATFK